MSKKFTPPVASSPIVPPVAPEPAVEALPMGEIVITLPVFDDPVKPFAARRIDLELNASQAASLRRIQSALDRQCATLKNGQRVVTAPQAIRWMLEQTA